MEYNELKKLAVEVADLYADLNKKDGHNKWTYREYLEGLIGDIGDLQKLIMAKSNYRQVNGDVDEKIAHELVDCLWSIIIIANNLNIDMESSFLRNINLLKDKIQRDLAKTRPQ